MALIDDVRIGVEKNPYGKMTGMDVEEVELGMCRGSLTLRNDVCNIYGSMHGGALFTLADMCAGAAVRSDGNRYVTQNAGVNYIRGITEGAAHCTAQVIHRGKTVSVVECHLTDDNGKLCLTATFSFFCLGK